MVKASEYLDDLAQIVNLDCGTFNRKGVERVARFIEEKFSPLGFRFRRIEVGDEVGPLLIGTNRDETVRGYDLVLSGHMDTVFPDGTSSELPLRQEGDRVYGAGAQDMKSGIINALYALRSIGKERLSKLAIALVFTPDEEISSRFSRETLKSFVAGSRFALVAEASPAIHQATIARKSIASYRIVVHGKAAHAARPLEGASAIRALPALIDSLYAIEDLDRGITVNIGTIEGGIGQNTLADRVEMIFEMRHLSLQDHEASHRALMELSQKEWGPEIRIEIEQRSFKPPMEVLEGSEHYQELIRRCAAEMGVEMEFVTAAGGSDGNYLASAGVPVIDSMGAVGKGAHTRSEYIELTPTLKRIELLSKVIQAIIEEAA